VEVAERFADGLADEHQMRKAKQVMSYGSDWRDYEGTGDSLFQALQACELTGSVQLAEDFLPELSQRVGLAVPPSRFESEMGYQADLLRELFGNPFRPTTPPSPGVLAWHHGTVVKVAQAIYDEREFDRLPILADALLDAGCEDESILSHCRGPGPHVRGCWVIDLILGKQ
jgi:hypothetical protein